MSLPVYVPAGEFLMGSADSIPRCFIEGISHTVTKG